MLGGAGLTGAARSDVESTFIDDFEFAVADFFDSGWGEADLKNKLGQTIDLACYAYGQLDETNEVERSQEPGFLSRLQSIDLGGLHDDQEAYNWVLKHLDNIGEFLGWLDVFPDKWAEEVTNLAESARSLTKYVPLIANVKGLLDTGCALHEQLEAGEDPSEVAYLAFFKQVALTIVEVILLVSSLKVAYHVAFGATGWVNQRLINVVGRAIGWRAYSWVLSQVHWGIRVVFTEGMDQAINTTTTEVANAVVTAFDDTRVSVPLSEATEQARSDVMQMAEHTDEWGPSFELWETVQRIKHSWKAAERRAERIKREGRSIAEWMPS